MDVSSGAVSFLAGSENRVEVLVALREAGEADQRTVAADVDASRRTVKRALDALEGRGWVARERGTGPYRVSALGDLVLDAYLDVLERLSVADRLGPFLAHVPAAAFDLDPVALADAEVVARGGNTPYAPMDRVLEVRRNASRVREVVDVIQADSASQLRERVEDGDLTAEVVLQAGVLDAVGEHDGYAAEFEAALAADGATFHVTEADVPFVFGLMDDQVVVGVTDDEGMPGALVVSDDPAVREWAESLFEAYRDGAEELQPA